MAAKTTQKKKPMAPVSLEGHTLGKYRILEPLGRGGMAQVYKAYHPQLDRYVAIKILRSDLVEEEEFLSRFRREARAVAALRHPNIVHIYDFDVQDDFYYMVMELLEGDTLKAQLNSLRVRGEKLPLGELVRIFVDVLSGLAYAHGEGIIHRDLKPANILLTKSGQAVLTDFGIAQIIGGTQYTVSGALMGTLSYMAPEQGLEGKCDAASDIYSLGIAFYEALTGSVPFDADTPLAILMKHINDPLPLPRAIDPTIPEAFERVALKALAKRPADRYQSAVEMTEALAKAAKEAGVDVPGMITLPQTRPASSVRTGPVAVFSGTARQQIADARFASDDTEINVNETTRRAAPQSRVSTGVLMSIGAMVMANILLLWAGGVVGWDVFRYAWPVEMLALSSLFTALMVSLSSPWLLIPGGIILGNGLLFSYFSLTGNWTHWTFLWPVEPVLLIFSIAMPFVLRDRGLTGRRQARRFGKAMLYLAGTVGVGVLTLGMYLATL